MALSLRVNWEVRPTGNASNAGGFDASVASPGTDYSQQDAAQFIRTDLVIGGANTVTSAAQPFTSAEAGNLLRILSGVGFTTGFYTITQVVGATATLDRSPGTLASTGGTGRVGGALTSVNDTPAIQGGIVWIRAGSGYTTGIQWVLSDGVGDGNFVAYIGYGTVRGDGLPATITATANLSPVLTQANQVILRNLVLDGAANTASRGADMGFNCYVENVKATGFNFSGIRAQNTGTRLRRCLFTNCGAGAAAGVGLDVGTGCRATACEATNCKQGFTSSNGIGEFVRCVARNSTGSGFYQQGANGMRLTNCTADGNAVDGLTINDSSGAISLEVVNSLFTHNAGFGIHSVATDYSTATVAQMASFFQNNAFYANGGNYSRVPAGAADVVLTAEPYTNRSSGDFSLNATAGGGASLIGAGTPGGFGLEGTGTLATTGHLDIGAAQTLGSVTSTATSTMYTMWREMTGEHDSTVITDDIPAFWIDEGLEALNRRIRYHWTTSTSAVTLVAGTQEYTLPSDLVEVRWIEWNGRQLTKGDPEEWRRRSDQWRAETVGEPLEWGMYGNQLIIRPAPSAEALAVAASLTIRYCSKPPAVATNGPEQLNSQDYRLPVLFGAAQYCFCYPDSQVAQQRAAALMKSFEDEVQVVAQDYGDRLLKR